MSEQRCDFCKQLAPRDSLLELSETEIRHLHDIHQKRLERLHMSCFEEAMPK